MSESGRSTERRGWRVLVTSRAFWNHGRDGIALMEAAGCELIRPARYGPELSADLIGLLQGCDASLASAEDYTARVFAGAPTLKMVARCGVGYDAVDLTAATAAGVVCTNTPGINVDAVADFTVGLILALARRITELDRMTRDGGWSEVSGVLLMGKTVGIVGLGHIGRAVARRMAAFGSEILATDPHVTRSTEIASMVPFDALLARSDIITVHAPSSPDTAGMFDAAAFASMKPGAYFVNTARGSIVVEEALLDALQAGHLAGAALDVVRQEPLPTDSPLRGVPNLILTAHNAFNAREAAARMCTMTAEQIVSLMRGVVPAATLNPGVYRSTALRIPRPEEA